MTVLILSFHELTQTGISPGPLVDTIIKVSSPVGLFAYPRVGAV